VPEININKNNEIGKVVQSKCNLAHRFGRVNRISALFEGEKKPQVIACGLVWMDEFLRFDLDFLELERPAVRVPTH
jgi:hypothetical protein